MVLEIVCFEACEVADVWGDNGDGVRRGIIIRFFGLATCTAQSRALY